MDRRRTIVSLVILATVGGCTASNTRTDYSERPTTEDLEPLPKTVTLKNARSVIRMCLQRHRESEGGIHQRYGYAFRDQGFVQFYRENPNSRDRRERFRRIYVDYKQITKAALDGYIDTAQFGSRTQVSVHGSFHQWNSTFSPYRSLPRPYSESSTNGTNVLLVEFDDESVAKKLVVAINLLAGK